MATLFFFSTKTFVGFSALFFVNKWQNFVQKKTLIQILYSHNKYNVFFNAITMSYFLGCDNSTLGKHYAVNCDGVGYMLHGQTKRGKKLV